jgi:hypothetical protein
MAVKTVEEAVATRDVDPGEWGRAILEDILFRAARDVSRHGVAELPVVVTMAFHLTLDEGSRTVEITTPGAVEPIIRTRLPL